MALTRPRAYQIYDIDYKQAVRVVTTSNITLSGGAPNSVDGVNLSLNDRVLVTGQSSRSQNGIYFVTTVGSGSNGTWARSIDANTTGEVLAGMIVMVTEGGQYADTQWKLLTDDPIVIGSTELTFAQNFGVPYTAAAVPPTANIVVGSQWFDTDTNVLYEYMYDGTSYYWIDITGPAIGTNGAQAGTYLANGNSNVAINDSNGAVTIGVTGTSNVGVFSSTGLTVTGNVTGSNLTTAGSVYVGTRGQIYDDGNFHIHSNGSGDAMWINTNAAQLNLLAQGANGGSVGTGVGIGTSSLTGFVTIQGVKSWTTASSYGYLINSASPTGQYNGGSQTITDVSLYANGRLMGIEIDALSDERAKNIQGNISLDDALTFVRSVDGILYTWRPEVVDGKDTGLKSGFSAQRVHKAGFGHMISMMPNDKLTETTDEDGWTSPDKTQLSMNYSQAIPYHQVVIKHLLDRIEQLEATVSKLTNGLQG